ncbi:hypothetical protein ABT061_37075 [Streptosporangium sp. NPDC002544]|uniref:hypothetical protein n=1 Tax=Streptosporangium sp. NPDC002544 TaxID=3154538 RepID=UPI0033281517
MYSSGAADIVVAAYEAGEPAERPRPVGVLARLAEARPPQTTKHLQSLERTGRRRVYALQPGPPWWRCGSPRSMTGRAKSSTPTNRLDHLAL